MKERDFENPVAESELDASQRTAVQITRSKSVEFDEESQRKAEERLKTAWCGLLHPDTAIRHLYDLAQLAIMFYLGYQLPLRLAFEKVPTGALEVALTIIIDASVWVDMYLQMRMAYYDPKTKKLITDRKRIKREYVRSWFLLDFFSVVPADQALFAIGTLLLANAKSDSVARWGTTFLDWSVRARLMRLVRLVRLAKLKQMLDLEHLIDTVYSIVKHLEFTKLQVAFYFRVAFLLMLNLAVAHFLGCLWLMIGRHNVLNEQNPSGWLAGAYEQDTPALTKDFVTCSGEGFDASRWKPSPCLNYLLLLAASAIHGSNCTVEPYLCAPVPADRPHDVDCSWIQSRFTTFGGTGFADGVGASESEQYLSAMYFAIVTLTTVGYGDILPDTPGEKQFVMSCIVFGAFLYAYIIGDFSNLLSNLSHERNEYDTKMRSMNDLLAYIDVPIEFKHKVQNYCDFKFNNKEGSQTLLQELPVSLQVELMHYRYGDLLLRVPFFANLPRSAVDELCQHMKSFTITPGDPIILKGDCADELLILCKGVARLPTRGDDGAYQTYKVGAFWGELEFLGIKKRRAQTVLATTYCEVASLSPNRIGTGSQIRARLSVYTEVVQSDLDDTLKQAELERKFRALDKAGQDDGGIDDEIRQSISGVGVVISDSERLEDLEMKVDGMGAQLDAILRILQAQPS